MNKNVKEKKNVEEKEKKGFLKIKEMFKDVENIDDSGKYDNTLVPRVMGAFTGVLGTGVMALGGATAVNNPAGVGLVKAGAGIAGVGAGILTASIVVDEVNYAIQDRKENAESKDDKNLSFSQRRALKYKNTEKTAKSITKKSELKKSNSKEIKKESNKKQVELTI